MPRAAVHCINLSSQTGSSSFLHSALQTPCAGPQYTPTHCDHPPPAPIVDLRADLGLLANNHLFHPQRFVFQLFEPKLDNVADCDHAT